MLVKGPENAKGKREDTRVKSRSVAKVNKLSKSRG